ncbi:MAG: hypothetical protein IK041_04250 [Bacteroidales bacterium]|nr:hypothetical protein [Bacteroidales bacterium]
MRKTVKHNTIYYRGLLNTLLFVLLFPMIITSCKGLSKEEKERRAYLKEIEKQERAYLKEKEKQEKANLKDIHLNYNESTLFLCQGEMLPIIATLEPFEQGKPILDTTIIWESDDPSIANLSFDEGSQNFIKANKEGSTYIEIKVVGKHGPKQGVRGPRLFVRITEDPIDLGLSVKWASKNLDAKNNTDIGRRVSWGNQFGGGSDKDTKYCIVEKGIGIRRYSKYNEDDRLGTLEKADDAAFRTLGGNWRMPTVYEFQELIDNCNWKYDNYNKGWWATSRITGNSIFFPQSGQFVKGYKEDYLYDSNCSFCWTASRSSASSLAHAFEVSNNFRAWIIGVERYYAIPIRPVYDSRLKNTNNNDNNATHNHNLGNNIPGQYNTSDPQTFGLMGAVKEVTIDGYDEYIPSLKFDELGRIIKWKEWEGSYNSNGKLIEKVEYDGETISRSLSKDYKGRICSINSDAPYDLGFIVGSSFKFDNEDRIIHEKGYVADDYFEIDYSYDGNNKYPSRIEVSGGYESVSYIKTDRYSYKSFDEIGNWTECEVISNYTSISHEPGCPEEKSTSNSKKTIKRKILYY